jgi:hypothetical protein
VAASLGVARKTIRKYVAPAIAAGMAPGEPARSRTEWAGLVRGWFPELVDTRLRQVTWPAIEVHRDYVAEQLAAGVLRYHSPTTTSIYAKVDRRALSAVVQPWPGGAA